MKKTFQTMSRRRIGTWFFLLLIFSFAIGGCSSKKLIHSKEARSLKKEVKEDIQRLVPLFAEPLSKGDAKVAQSILDKALADAESSGKPFKFNTIAILDSNSVRVAVNSAQQSDAPPDFSNYSEVKKVLKDHTIVQVKLYFQGGRVLYVILAPLLHQDETVGIIALGITEAEMKQRGIQEDTFLAIDFNS